MSEVLHMYLSQGYEITKETPTGWTLVKKAKQSVGIHILLAVTTCLVGNIIYYIVKDNDKKTVYVDKKNPDVPNF